MTTVLHLHREYRDYATSSSGGQLHHAPARVFLKAQVVHPRTGIKDPSQFRAILDTGAERTVIPLSATEYFERQTPASLVRGTPGQLLLADGTPRPDIAAFDVAFEFLGLSGDAGNRTLVSVSTYGRRHDGTWRSFPCFAWDYDRSVRDHKGTHRRFDHVIVGMDILQHWRVELDGPTSKYLVMIPPAG